MKIFITGATGFIGLAVSDRLIKVGHTVVGLARSQASKDKLAELGAAASSLDGSLEDLNALRRGPTLPMR